MTHILFISRYYLPEKAAAAACISEIAKQLLELGHHVTVLTTLPNYPTGVVPPEYRGHLVHKEVIAGVEVVRVWSYTSPNKGFLRRILSQLSFGCLAPLLAYKAISKPDVVIVRSPPLFNVIAAFMIAWWKSCPFIFWVADLWPESAISLGMLRNHLLIRLSKWLEWTTYQSANSIWVVTESLREAIVQRGVSAGKIVLITNGVDTERFQPLDRTYARAQLGWDERYTLLYAGNHGLVYAMTNLLDIAELLREYTDIHLILAGDGVKKAELIVEASRRGLSNITFLDSVAHEEMPLLWAAADVCLIPLRKISLVEGSLPLKMFEVMACARPFVLGAEGIARDLAEQKAKAGIVVEPENREAFVGAILYLREHPEEAESLGRRGRAYAKDYLDYKQLTATLDLHIETLRDNKDRRLEQRSLFPQGK